MYKAVLFDLDGTMVNTVSSLKATYMRFLELHKKKGTHAEFVKLAGPSIKEFLRELQTLHKLEGTYEELLKTYNRMLDEEDGDSYELFDGVREFLTYLKESGLKLAIVTSGTPRFVNKALKNHHVLDLFDAVITADDVVRSKPFPEIYAKALEKLHVKPEEAFAVEDTQAGLKAATQAGVETILIDYQKVTWNKIYEWMRDGKVSDHAYRK